MTAIYYIITAVTLLAGEIAYFGLARRYQILDLPNNRSMHEKPTIRGGGVVFYLSVLLFCLNTLLVSPGVYLYLLISVSLVSGIGLLDDIVSQSSRLRFTIQSVAFLVLFYGMGLYQLPAWWVVMVFIVATGTINAYNFMDGINGITGGYSMIILLGFLAANECVVHFTDTRFLITIMMGVMIFNFFNFRTKAICFAGDVGSTTIGFVIVFLLLQLIITTNNYVYIGMLAVYAADSLLTIMHRLWLRQNIFKAHRLHFFQIVVSRTGISHLTMTICFMAAQALITTILILNARKSPFEQYKTLFLIAAGLTTLYIMVKRRLMPAGK